MGRITDRPWINCCTREDVDDEPQPPYLHKCGCPAVEAICESLEKDAALCGYSEFPGFESVPARKYRSKAWVEGARTFLTYAGLCSPCVAVKTREQSIPELSGTDTIDPDTCAETLGSDSAAGTVTTQSWSGCPSPVLTGSTTTNPTRSQYGAPPIIESLSATTGRTVYPEVPGSACSGSFYYIGSSEQTDTATLSDEDTEADALDRTTAVAGSSCSSLWEIRTDDFDFIKRSADYALKASRLQIDAVYKARAYLRRRPAIKNPAGGSVYVDEDGNPSEWRSVDDEDAPLIDEYIFTATAAEMLVPTTGTWSDDNTDEVIDNEEVTPSIEIPLVQGWEYQIESVSIELALTSETP